PIAEAEQSTEPVADAKADLPSLPSEPAAEPVLRHEAVDVVICVHDALESVRACLQSVLRGTMPPYRVILVDDGSGPATASYLDQQAEEQRFTLLRNPEALGYTKAANLGLRAAVAPWVVLLNSDTVVTPGWLDRMWAHGARDPKVGVIGPLSNTASWQSVPRVFDGPDWAENALPAGTEVDHLAALVAAGGIGTIPMPFLNGFCYMIRGSLLREVGVFDEVTFGGGYGEENDFSIRARQAGWALVVASDVYVYHAQSRSYSGDRRGELAAQADGLLMQKYQAPRDIWPYVAACRDSMPMASMRARLRGAIRRERLIAEGRRRFEGRRVAFILPIENIGGGANVILQEGAALERMGVDVTLLNEKAMHDRLGPSPDLRGLQVRTFRSWEAMTSHLARGGDYDAVVATLYRTVYMLPLGSNLRLGYYVQDFEPYFFEEGTPEHESALLSYTLSDRIRLLTKTRWNQVELARHTGRHATLLGPSVDVSAFAPDPAYEPGGRLRITAMIRPSTPRRAPEWTVAVMDRIRAALGDRVTFATFGASEAELHAAGLLVPWAEHAGRLDRHGLAGLLGRSDVFLDCSRYQAMGLTALEAMLCGGAVIAPERGGANEFIRTGLNGVLLDTVDQVACAEAVIALAADPSRLTALRQRAIADANEHVPEQAARRLLAALFDA
ncbi:MAG: glycosyltransferase, partial [Acetobacteraceae bacterium]|nr:glycosyltransferase [Acetobacteraceae bacterium]